MSSLDIKLFIQYHHNMVVSKYNTYTNKYELVPEDWVIKFNTITNVYEFAPPDNKLIFNTQEKEYILRKDRTPNFNIQENRYELGKEWDTKFNTQENQYIKVPKVESVVSKTSQTSTKAENNMEY